MLWVLPLEKLNERYTEQWYRWVEFYLQKYDVKYTYVYPDIEIGNSVKTGKVLDASNTMMFKFEQLKIVAEKFKNGEVKNGDKFFVFDGQFPGIESIKYMSTMYNIETSIFAYFHAGSYTRGDFTNQMKHWFNLYEIAWFNFYDKIFVGTNYHKQAILTRNNFSVLDREDISKKIFVSGNIYKSDEVLEKKSNKKFERFTIIWPNRFDYEKNPKDLVLLAERNKQWDFLITTSRKKLTNDELCFDYQLKLQKLPNVYIFEDLSKDDYYRLMSMCHVYLSTSNEEMFGICLLEAITLGLYPVVKRGLSHSEILEMDSNFLYENFEDMEEKIFEISASNKPTDFDFKRYDYSMMRILYEIGEIK